MAVWPCRLKIIACFCKRDPIILGVDILDGTLRLGTPLCVVKNDPTTGAKEIIELGKMYAHISPVPSFVRFTLARSTSLEINHKNMEVCVKNHGLEYRPDGYSSRSLRSHKLVGGSLSRLNTQCTSQRKCLAVTLTIRTKSTVGYHGRV
jgi:hypothetical protein